MGLKGNGQLLMEVDGFSLEELFTPTVVAKAPPIVTDSYKIEPLFQAVQTTNAFSVSAPATHWVLARPQQATKSTSPWDQAHALAKANNYAHYVEPDLVTVAAVPPATAAVAAQAANDPWPPRDPVSAGWHLGPDFTGIGTIRELTKGDGVRIAHLDTGYTKNHPSKPAKLREDLAWDFWANRAGAVDPGTQGPLNQPGHGTATLALLAAPQMNLPVGTIAFNDWFGGAPESEVVPVRISPSVVHLATSSMARGISYALAPLGNAANRCDVITLSHGGLPANSWAAAVNDVYEAGIIVAAASGDNFYAAILDIVTRFTVYPSAFNRVITVVGADYSNAPYITNQVGGLQGNWGPNAVMEKAIAAYTPKVAWMNYRGTPVFTMTGAGTSASTPQVAAACALWLSLYGTRLPKDWRRIEACRVALFESTRNHLANKPQLGWGVLNVPELLDETRADDVIQRAMAGKLQKSAVDAVSFALWRLLVGEGPPNSQAERMYEVEAAQVVLNSSNTALVSEAQSVAAGGQLSANEISKLRAALAKEQLSAPLRARLAAAK